MESGDDYGGGGGCGDVVVVVGLTNPLGSVHSYSWQYQLDLTGSVLLVYLIDSGNLIVGDVDGVCFVLIH